MKCPNCGYENRETAHFCQGCGAALATQNPAALDVSRQPTQPLPPTASPLHSLPATRPLSEASIAFAPLPEGALLHEGQYVVVETRTPGLEKAERLNVYLVEDTTPVRLCPNCRAETADPEERFCSYCGADLSGVEPLHLRYLTRESADEHAFAVEAHLLETRLDHPDLLLPRDVFVESPYGPHRRYLVEPEFSPPLATTLSVPQELNQVLEWGVSLAQALDYLHRHQITLREVGLNHIAVEGKTARWIHLGTAYVVPPEARSTAAGYFAQDVQGLATALFYLATGQQQYTADVSLPEQVTTLFSQALTAPAGLTVAAFASALEAALEELRRPASVTLVVGHRTDVGQERSLNEDSLLTLSIAPVFRSVSAPVGLFVVADGMGGHEAGDVASQLAIRTIAPLAVSEVLSPAAAGKPLPDTREWLTAATQAANRAVYEQRRAAGNDMGTTLVMALFIGDTAIIANVGDSRAYLLRQRREERGERRGEEIVQITTDHSLVERLVATGQITPEEAVDHPQKNVIYRVIGDKLRLEVDLFEQRLNAGEALLLCSDGLSGMVPDEQIWHTWRTSTSPREACDRLVEAANQAGGEDNVTVVIVQVSR